MNAKELEVLQYSPDPVIYKTSNNKLWVEAKITMPEYIKGRAKGTAKQGIDGKYYRQVRQTVRLEEQRYSMKLYQFIDDPNKFIRIKNWVRGPMSLLGSAFFKDK